MSWEIIGVCTAPIMVSCPYRGGRGCFVGVVVNTNIKREFQLRKNCQWFDRLTIYKEKKRKYGRS